MRIDRTQTSDGSSVAGCPTPTCQTKLASMDFEPLGSFLPRDDKTTVAFRLIVKLASLKPWRLFKIRAVER